jgi:peroxiredoxin Q/BCP
VRDTAAELDKFKVVYFTASVDDADTNKRFAESLELKYPILSDPDKKVATTYGVLNPAGAFARRWTFVIDDQGIIRAIDTEVKAASHGTDLVGKLQELGVPKK